MRLRCLLLAALWLCTRDLGSPSEHCEDWGVGTRKRRLAYGGEPARIRCPLLEALLKCDYSTAHAAGLTLIWYRVGRGQDLEEPLNFRLPDNRVSKEKDALWFRPAFLNDTGNYTCMLRNATYCNKFAFPLEVVGKDPGLCLSRAIRPEEVLLYADFANQNLTCPDVDGFYPATTKPDVRWYKNCTLVQNFFEREPNGVNLTFIIVREAYNDDYTCVVTYRENGRQFTLTRTLRVKVVGSPYDSKVPFIKVPNDRVVYELKPGEELVLRCEVYFTFLKDSLQDVWWTVDGKLRDEFPVLTFNTSYRETPLVLGSTRIENTLILPKVTEQDLKRNFTCHAHNNNGTVSQQALVKMKAPLPRYTVELVCGLGATVLLVVALTVVYHVYWLELVLFYRAHFGTDESILDGKEYDIYISYARNAEEEEFVLLTLRGVLESEFGYKLCIFDRDSLPGGNLTEAVFDFIQRSRKMIVVLSPDYLLEKSISMLELKLGLLCQNHIATRLVVVEYRPLPRAPPCVQQLRDSAACVAWRGERSRRPGSTFWKALRLALPLRSLSAAGASAWNESCSSSHSDMSLEHIQKKRRRLKGLAGGPDPRPKGLPVPRGPPPPPRSRAKEHPTKPFLACRCCVAYCNRNHKPGGHGQAGATAPRGAQLSRPLAGEPPATLQKPQLPARSLCPYADLSNNNDLYIL